MQILKICEYCKNDFIAKKTTSKTCSDDCAKRLYKLKLRKSKIAQAQMKKEIKHKPKACVTEDEIKVIQAKEYLTLNEAALLLNVSPLTLRRWIFSGKICSIKVGKKHQLKKSFLHHM